MELHVIDIMSWYHFYYEISCHFTLVKLISYIPLF